VNKPRVVAVVLARLGSSRFPRKVLAHLAGKPLLLHVVEAACGAQLVDAVVLATSDGERDDELAAFAADYGIAVWRGSEADVLARFAAAARHLDADAAVRLTVDNPLVTGGLIDRTVAHHLLCDADYTGNFLTPAQPDGLEVEVVARRAIDRLLECARTDAEREHVTWYIRTHVDDFCVENIPIGGAVEARKEVSLSVDTPADLEREENLYGEWRGLLAGIN
jgi:spore coat polysaccharide biosynthesis protein SpsF (cytidylyltransferase family)